MLCAIVVTVLGGTLARQEDTMLVERDVIVLFGGISLIFRFVRVIRLEILRLLRPSQKGPQGPYFFFS